jgi:hypothetical protein
MPGMTVLGNLTKQLAGLPVVAGGAGYSDVVLRMGATARQRDDMVEMNLTVGEGSHPTQVTGAVVPRDDAGSPNRLGLGPDQSGAAYSLPVEAGVSIAEVEVLALFWGLVRPVLAAVGALSLWVGVVVAAAPLSVLREQSLTVLSVIAGVALALLVGVSLTVARVSSRLARAALSLALGELIERLRLLSGPAQSGAAGRVGPHTLLESPAVTGGPLLPPDSLVSDVAGTAARTAPGALVTRLREGFNRERPPTFLASLHTLNYIRHLARRTMQRRWSPCP